MIEFGESPTLLSWTVLAVTSGGGGGGGGGGEMDGKQRDPLKEEGKKISSSFFGFSTNSWVGEGKTISFFSCSPCSFSSPIFRARC